MAYAHQGIELKPLPGRPAPTVAAPEQAVAASGDASSQAPQRPATLSTRAADALRAIEIEMIASEKQRVDAGFGANAAANARQTPVAVGNGGG